MMRSPDRRGSVYIMVLAAGAALTAMGIAGLALVRSQRATEELRQDAQECRQGARSGLDLMTGLMATDVTGEGTWRKDTSQTYLDLWLGGSQVAVFAEDPLDADLADSIEDPVLLTVTARKGAARQMLRAKLTPRMQSLTCMRAAVWADSALTMTSATIYSGDVVGTNGAASATTSTVNASVAAASIGGGSYLKSNRVLTDPLEVPRAAAVADWTALGTPIAYASLSGGQLRGCVLSPGSNPYGAVNARGIYVIDCAGANITVRNCRVNGTLILLRPGGSSYIDAAVFLEARSGQPALLVAGAINFTTTAGDLTESAAGANLNPAGSPYLGSSDSDSSDRYPSVIEGVVFATGDVSLKSGAVVTVQGSIITRGVFSMNSATLVVRQQTPATPIPGFSEVAAFVVDPASVVRVVE